MRGSKQDVTIYDYLPHLARNYSDACEMLDAGCWTGKVTLIRANGECVERRLRVQLSGSPYQWGEWGAGESLTASERIPDGLLRCLLYTPHNWMSTDSLVDFVKYVEPRYARGSLRVLCKKAVRRQMLSGSLEKNVKDAGLTELLPAPSSVDIHALEEFARLLETVSDHIPHSGPPGGGMSFVRELKRRILRGRVQEDTADRQIRELLFGAYLPGYSQNELAVGFFCEVIRFLRAATGRTLEDISEAELADVMLRTQDLVRESAKGRMREGTVIEKMRRLLMDLVYGRRVPKFGNSPDYLKCLKAASLADDHGRGDEEVAALIGLAGSKKRSGLIPDQIRQRLRTYQTNGRRIRKAIPEEFFDRHGLFPKIK